MANRTKELWLDLGCGSGGTYLNDGNNWVGTDINLLKLALLRHRFPNSLPVSANGEYLPYADNVFDGLQIVLPFNMLSLPGLTCDNFALLEPFKTEYKMSYPNGWYPEFGRVVKPGGLLKIFADLWVDPDEVKQAADGYFTIEKQMPLSVDRLVALYTDTAREISSRRGYWVIQKNAYWEDLLFEMWLRNVKCV